MRIHLFSGRNVQGKRNPQLEQCAYNITGQHHTTYNTLHTSPNNQLLWSTQTLSYDAGRRDTADKLAQLTRNTAAGARAPCGPQLQERRGEARAGPSSSCTMATSCANWSSTLRTAAAAPKPVRCHDYIGIRRIGRSPDTTFSFSSHKAGANIGIRRIGRSPDTTFSFNTKSTAGKAAPGIR
jgi:hypothetical protein